MKFAWIHTEKASYPLSKPAPLENFFTLIAEATTRYFGKGIEPQLECEPGRGLVADCMSLLTRIKLVCSDGDDIFLLAVEDDGCGMPAEATPKGTGLGTVGATHDADATGNVHVWESSLHRHCVVPGANRRGGR